MKVFAKWCNPMVHDQNSRMCTCAREIGNIMAPSGLTSTIQMEVVWRQRSDIVNKYFGERLIVTAKSHPIDKLAKLLGSALIRKSGLKLTSNGQVYEKTTYVTAANGHKVAVPEKQHPTVFYGEPTTCWTWDDVLEQVNSIMDESWSRWKDWIEI